MCGDIGWGWLRHNFSPCKKCGSLVDTKAKSCDYCKEVENDEFRSIREEYRNKDQ